MRVGRKGAVLLVRCLDGVWLYPTDSQGHIRNDALNKKSRCDHLRDGSSHLGTVLVRKTDTESRKRDQLRPPPRLSQQRQREGIIPLAVQELMCDFRHFAKNPL